MGTRTTILFALALLLAPFGAEGAPTEPADSVEELDEVVVRAPRGVRKLQGATNTQVMSVTELRRAACCNLGESFSTNPSVDVSYTDAATGARRIRLLGLQGSYVQMLTENVPAMRGAAAPFGLSYIPGPWMQSIQVSKGASSVKNGYESLTGQINVELKKPQLDPSLSINGYYDSMNKAEINADGNLHFGPNWSGGLLLHGENSFEGHDSDGDGFLDAPKIRQFSALNRWAYMGRNYVMQAAGKFLAERRTSGQHSHHGAIANPYEIGIDTRRWEVFVKNAYMFDHEAGTNVALILSGSGHNQDAAYGFRINDIDQHEAYASLMYETTWTSRHALSAGLSFNYDHIHYRTRLQPDASVAPAYSSEREAVGGAYAQYTFNLDDRLVAMAGLRYDCSDLYGSLLTPRLHLRYTAPRPEISLHASAGRGARSPHPLAEYGYLLASSRRFEVIAPLRREEGWNMGAGADWTIRPAGRKVTLGAEYYFTDSRHSLTLDLDSDPHAAILNPDGRSRSHAVQAEITAEPLSELSFDLAWRYTAVYQTNMGGTWTSPPLLSRWKVLVGANYAPRMGLWQFDVTCAINGPGRMPAPYRTAAGDLSWQARYKAFPQLNAQITRNFRHWAVYIGGENITGYRQKRPIVAATDPWSPDFDATMIHGPLHGAMVYVGFRYNITKYL